MSELTWTTLPVDLKKDIVDFLYYTDRQSLSQCSKSDRALVASSRWVFDRIDYLINRDTKKSMEVEHRYRMDMFTENGKGVDVEKRYRTEVETCPRWTTKSEVFVDDRDWQDMASDRLNEMLKAQNYRIDDLKMDLGSKVPVFNHTVYANGVQISAEVRRINAEDLFRMVDSLHSTIDWLQFTLSYEIPNGLGLLETVRKAKRLIFSELSSINDEELIDLEAVNLDIWKSEITRKGMRKFVHKRYDMGIECQFDVEASGEERIEVGFECEAIEEGTLGRFPHAKWKLTKPESDFVCYICDLENEHVSGIIEKKSDL